MNRVLIGCCLVLIGAAQGCSSTSIEPRPDTLLPRQIQVADENLRRVTRFGEAQVTRDAAGLLYVTVPLRATIDQTIYVQYRATFLDENGQPLPGSPTSWFDKTLTPRVHESVSVNSTSPRAAQFTIDFRYAR